MMKLSNGVTLKPIPISPNSDYMAGDDGQIYSRTKYAGFGRKEYVDWYPLKGHQTGKGYRSVSLCHENRKVTRNVHRLICLAFHGNPAKSTLQVRHLDGNPENNVPSNLAWGTQEENWLDRKEHGNGNSGEKHHASKLSDEERSFIRWAISKEMCSQRMVARRLGMSQSSIWKIVHSK